MQYIKISIEEVETSLRDFLKENKTIKLLKEYVEKIRNGEIRYQGSVPTSIRNDSKILFELFVNHPECIDYEIFPYKKNKKFFLDAIKVKNSDCVNFWKNFRKLTIHKDVFKEVIKIKPEYYKNIRKDLEGDKEYALEIINEGGNIYPYLSDELLSNKEIVMACLDKFQITSSTIIMKGNLNNDTDVLRKLIEIFGFVKDDWISDEVLRDITFNNEIVSDFPEAFYSLTFGKIAKSGSECF